MCQMCEMPESFPNFFSQKRPWLDDIREKKNFEFLRKIKKAFFFNQPYLQAHEAR